MTKLRVVNIETGEDLSQDYTLRHRKQDETYRKLQLVGTDTRHFSFTNMQNIREVTANLSNVYCGYIIMLQPHIQWQTNLLVVNNTPMKRKDLEKALVVSSRTIKSVVSELKEHEIIFENHDATFTINERYHFRKKAGDDVDALIKTFFTALKKFSVKPADLGFVYKLLPNVHYDTNMICADPFARNPADIRFLSEKQIGELVGMSNSKTRATLTRLRKVGIIGVWNKGEDSREKLTVLNPYVFYRRKGKPDDTLKALFTAHVYEG